MGIRTTTSMKIPTSKKLLSPETDEKYDYFEFCTLTQCNFCVFGTAMADFQVVAISADFFSISARGMYITFILRFLWRQILHRRQHHKEQ